MAFPVVAPPRRKRFIGPYFPSLPGSVDQRALAKEEEVLSSKMKAVDEDVSGTLAKTGDELQKEAEASVAEQRRVAAAAAQAMKEADDVLNREAAAPQLASFRRRRPL